MSVSNLTGTTWIFNDSLNITSNNTFLINFIDSNAVSYNALYYFIGTGLHLQYYTNYPDNFERVYMTENGPAAAPGSEGWVNQSYKIITITGGQDVTNSNLISFLENNAKQLIEYKTDSIEIGSIADAIRSKGGTSASLVYPTGFVSAIEAIETSGNTEIEDALVTKTIGGTYENSRVYDVGEYAFYGCLNLTSVSFPVCTTIRSYAFCFCGLTSISFPACTDIGLNVFEGCFYLTSISFPVCTTIGSSAFGNCSSLTSISFPVCIYINSGAFRFCASLTSISFPSCTTIVGDAFAHCVSLTSISFPVCTTIGSGAFGNCSSLTSIKFPACTSIGNYAFSRCNNLTSASFPACTFIASTAFSGCTKLISLYLPGSSYVTLKNSNAFSSTPIAGYSSVAGRYGSIYVPASMLSSYKTKTNWTYFSSRFVGR